MAKPDKKAALKRLTKARKALEEYKSPTREAEKGVRFGSQRGWNYTTD